MPTSSEVKLWFQEHKWAVIGVSITVAIIIAVAVTLGVTLGRRRTDTSSRFKGPSDINGDPVNRTSTSSDQFGDVQTLAAPAGQSYLGMLAFAHDAGYICAVSLDSMSRPVLNFYRTNEQGAVETMHQVELWQSIPTGYKVVNGQFAPIFNLAGEVYYLFLSVGVVKAGSTYPSDAQLYATHVVCLALNTAEVAPNGSSSNLQWTLESINSQSAEELKGPSNSVSALRIPVSASEFIWDSAVPYVGTFGDTLQVVLDDNETNTKQSLYVRGSEYDSSRPGGNLYWFILEDNAQQPTIELSFIYQDGKLLQVLQCRNDPACVGTLKDADGKTGCPPIVKSETYYMNGFGTSFFVTSGNGKGNVMVVANPTNEDNCQLAADTNNLNPPAPKGYVQGYTWDSSQASTGWVQPTPPDNTSTYFYRYPARAADTAISVGFGYGVGWIDNVLIAGEIYENGATGAGVFHALQWTKTPIGTSNNQLTERSHFTAAEQTSIEELRYNSAIVSTDNNDNVLVTGFNADASKDAIAIVNPLVDPSVPFSKVEVRQSIGASVNSGTGGDKLPRLGFGQSSFVWLSRTGLTVRLLTNDPLASNGGRLLVYSKARST